MQRNATRLTQVICLLSLTTGAGLHTAGATEMRVTSTPTPPQYLTAPIHAPELQQDLINGRLTFAAAQSGKPPVGGGGGGGSTSFSSAAFSLQPQSAVMSSVNAVMRPDSYQGETAIASLGDGSRWVGGYNSIYPSQCNATLANCAPGATLITTSSTPPSFSRSTLPLIGNLVGFDPSVAIDGAGTVYYGYGVCSGSCSTANVLVATAPNPFNNELVWTAHVVTPPASNIFDDKYWVAADSRTAGKAYITWTRNKGNNQTIMASYTVDSGQTWSGPVKVNDGTSQFERVLYAMPAVSPVDGTIFVAWMDYAKKAIYVDKSTNGGVSWGRDVKAASLNATFTDLGCNGGRSMAADPYIAVDSQGWVYVSFADIKGSTGMDIYVVYSKNGGSTWSTPYRLNDDQTSSHQYNSAMNVLGSGKVHVSWLDRREDNNNCTTKAYSTYSSGALDQAGTPTFSINLPLIDTASNFDGNPNGPGDYTGIAVFSSTGGDEALPFYPTHLPNDISTETNTAGGFEAYITLVSP